MLGPQVRVALLARGVAALVLVLVVGRRTRIALLVILVLVPLLVSPLFLPFLAEFDVLTDDFETSALKMWTTPCVLDPARPRPPAEALPASAAMPRIASSATRTLGWNRWDRRRSRVPSASARTKPSGGLERRARRLASSSRSSRSRLPNRLIYLYTRGTARNLTGR